MPRKKSPERTLKKKQMRKCSEIFNINFSDREADDFLKRYGFGLWEFVCSVFMVAALFLSVYEEKRKVKSLRARIAKLETLKKRIAKNLDGASCSDISIREVNKTKLRLEDNIKFLERYGFTLNGQRIRIDPSTLLILIWSFAMQVEGKKGSRDFENMQVMLLWFSQKKNWGEFFGKILALSKETIRLTYERYIKYPKDRGEDYRDLAILLYSICFLEVDNRIKKFFPDPFDYVKMQVEGMYRLALREKGKLGE